MKGKIALINRKDNIKREKLLEGKETSSSELDDLKKQLFSMQLEIDILKETIDVLKNKYSLPTLFKILSLLRSSYYYHKKLSKVISIKG